MKLSKEKMMREAERVLKRTEEYQSNRELGIDENYQIIYLLTKGSKATSDNVIVFAGCEEAVISFNPFRDEKPIENWDFNFESDLFGSLESGYELAEMSLECHCNVWCTIEDWHGDIECLKGMQKYLGYCKRNGITREKLQSKVAYSGMDVMTLYDPKTDRAKRSQEYER